MIQHADRLHKLLVNDTLPDPELVEPLTKTLENLNQSLDKLNQITGKMQCCNGLARLNPNDYFNTLRPFLSNHEHGIIYSNCELSVQQPIVWRGASGAQSSILPALDRILQLDVIQLNTMQDMIHYMPPEHQWYLDHCQEYNTNLLKLCQRSVNTHFINNYRQAIKQVIAFRRKHYIVLVVPFIIEQITHQFSYDSLTKLCTEFEKKEHIQTPSFVLVIKNILVQLSIRFKMEIILSNQEALLEANSKEQLQKYIKALQKNIIHTITHNHPEETSDIFLEQLAKKFIDIAKYELKDYLMYFSIEELIKIITLIFAQFEQIFDQFKGTGGVDFSYFLPNNIEQCLKKLDKLPTPNASPKKHNISRFMFDKYSSHKIL